MPTKNEYLNLIKESYEHLLATYEQSLESWRKDLKTADTYNPPGTPLSRAVMEGFLYSVTKDEKYAEQAREALLSYIEFPKEVPDRIKQLPKYSKGVFPVCPGFGGITLFLKAYEFIKDSRTIKNKDKKTFKQIIGNSADQMFSFPEWGPHNRAAKNGLSLTYAAKVFADHPQATKWAKMGQLLMDASLKHWSLEDTEMYCFIWLVDLLIYTDVIRDSSLYKSPLMRYYFDYFKHLLCPLGMVPDYGDSMWLSPWELSMIFFEKGATIYRDSHMKYAADQIYRIARGNNKLSAYGVFTYLWADDEVECKVPDSRSTEVIDEVIGKKIVFRNGWNKNSTYLLLNYMDEGDIGWYYKEHLRNTLVVTAEKMHHGHADENSVIALIKNGAFLLHDGGYREGMPNGAYRADVYHNRIVVREGKPKNQTLFDFMHNMGIYQTVRTKRVHFKTFKDIDVSRTEVTDENNYQWDRVITYLKGLDAFVIHDGVKILRNGEFTVGNLYWTQKIHKKGVDYFDTSIDLIGLVGAWGNPRITLKQRRQFAWSNRKSERLLIYFYPDPSKTIDVSKAMRNYLPETCVHQSYSNDMKKDDYVSFITVLWPHRATEPIEGMLKKIESINVDLYPRASAIRFNTPTDAKTICVKHDLSFGLARPYMRPMYTYAAGKIQYGEITTDAAYTYMKLSKDQLTYALIDGMKMIYNEKTIFSSDEPSVYDLSHRPDIIRNGIFKTDRDYWEYELKTKWDSWEDTISF